MNRDSERNIRKRNQANLRKTPEVPKAPETEINLDMLWPPENDADYPDDDTDGIYLDEDYPDDGYIDEEYLNDLYSEEDYIDEDDPDGAYSEENGIDEAYPNDAYSEEYDPKAGKSGRETAGRRAKPAKSEKRRKKKHFHPGRLLLLLVLFLAACGGLWVYAVNTVYDRMHYDPVESVQYTAMETEGVTNILLIGNDSREDRDDGRSDA